MAVSYHTLFAGVEDLVCFVVYSDYWRRIPNRSLVFVSNIGMER
jgi:hypothetical protein